MSYQKAWLELKSMIDDMHDNAYNSMSSMTENAWTESLTKNILEKMEYIEKNTLTKSEFGELANLPEIKEKTTTEKQTEIPMKNVYLVKFKKSAVMQGRYGALVIVDDVKGSIERAIVRETGMLSTSVLSANIESIKLVGAKPSSQIKKDVAILTDHQYHSFLVQLKQKKPLN